MLSIDDSVKNDTWLSQAVYVSAKHHKDGFIKAFKGMNANYKAKSENLPVHSKTNDASWPIMNLPTSIEKAGLKIDGRIWFRRTVNIPTSGQQNLCYHWAPSMIKERSG